MSNSGKKPPTDFSGLAAALCLTMQKTADADTTSDYLNKLFGYGGGAPDPSPNALAALLAAASAPKPTPPDTLTSILEALGATPISPLNALAAAAIQPSPLDPTFLGGILDDHRSRSSWNDRFEHWEKPASVSEVGTIERAQSNVLNVLSGNTWLVGQGVKIARQGSYQNRTNVRTEADIDLRAEHPALRIDYATDVVQQSARAALGFRDYGLTYQQIFDAMRDAMPF